MRALGESRPAPRAVVALALMAAASCAPSFREARPTEPLQVSGGTLQVQARRLMITDDVLTGSVGDGTALVVELIVTNNGRKPYTLSAARFSCELELDARALGKTRALMPAGGAEGPFPAGPIGDETVMKPVTVPPGQAREYWAVFSGYAFEGSDVARRVTLVLPDAEGHPLRLVLADPPRGQLRWTVAAPASGWMIGLQNASLYGSHLNGTATSTQVARVFRAGPLLWEIGLGSRLLVQVTGELRSPTSSFLGTGPVAHVTWPFLGWGTWQDPRRIGVYAGGEAQLLIALEPPRAPGDTTPPITYGLFSGEAGLELDVGALALGASPFPLQASGRRLPRWSARLGYTHWWVGHGHADGYVSAVRLSW